MRDEPMHEKEIELDRKAKKFVLAFILLVTVVVIAVMNVG